MKSVLISIQPKWVEKIVNGEKTIEVRKIRPNIETPFMCYIYCTKDKRLVCKFDKGEDCYGYVLKEPLYVHSHCWINDHIVDGKVIGEFICDKVDEYNFHEGLTEFNSMGLPSRIYGSYLIFTDDYKSMCLSYDEVKNYGKGKTLYGLHISDLKIYDKPKELSEFSGICSNIIYEELCVSIMRCEYKKITRPPQSYMYVEEN